MQAHYAGAVGATPSSPSPSFDERLRTLTSAEVRAVIDATDAAACQSWGSTISRLSGTMVRILVFVVIVTAWLAPDMTLLPTVALGVAALLMLPTTRSRKSAKTGLEEFTGAPGLTGRLPVARSPFAALLVNPSPRAHSGLLRVVISLACIVVVVFAMQTSAVAQVPLGERLAQIGDVAQTALNWSTGQAHKVTEIMPGGFTGIGGNCNRLGFGCGGSRTTEARWISLEEDNPS